MKEQARMFSINGSRVGDNFSPSAMVEIGINNEGSYKKAEQMARDAQRAAHECVKFQCYIIEDELIPNNVIPGNATESIWDIM